MIFCCVDAFRSLNRSRIFKLGKISESNPDSKILVKRGAGKCASGHLWPLPSWRTHLSQLRSWSVWGNAPGGRGQANSNRRAPKHVWWLVGGDRGVTWARGQHEDTLESVFLQVKSCGAKKLCPQTVNCCNDTVTKISMSTEGSANFSGC